GGRLEAGATVLRIERRDYETQVSQAKAAVERAALELELERGRKSIADREWKLLGEGDKADARSRARALREPQLKNAEAQLEAAKAQLEQARANVRRTTLEAPFNALVVSESVDLGQLVSPQAMVARLVGTDAFWVEVAVPVADLHWLQVPGATAQVVHDTGGARVVKQGTVVRLMGDLDPVGRMARLLVEVPAPLDGETPLLLGAYVDVEIGGKPVEDVFEVPRVALREGDTLWVMGVDGTLEIRPATITRRLRDRVLVSDGLRAGDQLIVSRLPSPVPGMKVRPKTTT
ncbi:MAG: efflux RND transporter periplasmic adaptor subunit, partial [Myxococcales bacterium]|nr:efflux RND transporter periplasmic adaptor subunit [Myxococcales bacterium]